MGEGKRLFLFHARCAGGGVAHSLSLFRGCICRPKCEESEISSSPPPPGMKPPSQILLVHVDAFGGDDDDEVDVPWKSAPSREKPPPEQE